MSGDGESWKIEAAKELSHKRDTLLAERKELTDSYQRKIREIDDKLSEVSISARSLELPVAWLREQSPNIASSPNLEFPGLTARPLSQRKPFKDRALELLEEAYPKPLKAAEIQKKIEAEYGAKYHDKTSGMSLYRLSNDGLVRRTGHHWYFIPPEQRLIHEVKENPGSGSEPEDPGSMLE